MEFARGEIVLCHVHWKRVNEWLYFIGPLDSFLTDVFRFQDLPFLACDTCFFDSLGAVATGRNLTILLALEDQGEVLILIVNLVRDLNFVCLWQY